MECTRRYPIFNQALAWRNNSFPASRGLVLKSDTQETDLLGRNPQGHLPSKPQS